MRDLFDDFMEELRRREAIARGEDPGPPRRRGEPGDDGDDDREVPDDGDDAADDRSDAADDSDAADQRSDEPVEEPQRIDQRRRRRRRGRPPGGPNDGAGGRAARFGRRFAIVAILLIALGVFLLFSVGLDLWTEKVKDFNHAPLHPIESYRAKDHQNTEATIGSRRFIYCCPKLRVVQRRAILYLVLRNHVP